MAKKNNEQFSDLIEIELEKQQIYNQIHRLQDEAEKGKRVKGKLEQQERLLRRLIRQEAKVKQEDRLAEDSSEYLSKLNTKVLLDAIEDRGYFVSKVPPSVSGKTFKVSPSYLSKNTFKFGVISCTHLGSKYQQMTHLTSFYEECGRQGANLVLHCGDLVDGEKIYRGQEYELFLHGADAQRDYVINNYPRVDGLKTKIILGNHDESFWSNSGINVVKAVCEKRDDMEYLGDYLAYLEMANIRVGIMHAGGGVAYARSYKPQKIVEQLSPEKKPHLMFIGHWHVACSIPRYRNVETFSLGAFQDQTPYLVRKGLDPNVTGLIIEVLADSTGLLSVKQEWIHYYVPVKNDF